MENFIVSARKYRPSNFDMVVGQESITNTLKSAISSKHLAQAYLFCGPRGVGKTTCARIFAKTINCMNLDDKSEACDSCESCVSFNTLRSFNIHELDAASNNKVEDIRSLNDQVRIPPQVGKYSIYIIDEVHMLSSSAFNAFLKTLEEPPSHAIFILATTEKHKIIPTILSRCQIFDFNRIKVEDIVARLKYVADNESVNAEEDALHVIAQKADGALRDALSIFDQIVSLCGKNVTYKDVIENLNVLDYEYYFRCIDSAIMGDLSSLLVTFDEVLQKGFDGHNFISGLNSHFRDLLVCKDESTLPLIETLPAVKKRYLKQTEKCPVDFIYKALEIGTDCDLNFKNSKNQRLHVELSLIRLCRLLSSKGTDSEKKSNDSVNVTEKKEKPLTTPSKSESIVKGIQSTGKTAGRNYDKPVFDNASKAFSIKEIISDENQNSVESSVEEERIGHEISDKTSPIEKFSGEAFSESWKQFLSKLKGESPRIISMFKEITPEVVDDKIIKIHLINNDQRDTFVHNYKQRLIAFLESKFVLTGIEIEVLVDQSVKNDILYSDDQKYNYLVDKYPVLNDMKKNFNLDIT